MRFVDSSIFDSTFKVVLLVCFLCSFICNDAGVLEASSGEYGSVSEEKLVTILTTTDIHGSLLSYDYNREVEIDNSGLTRIASFIKARRRLDPDLLLIDAGDTFQGNPMVHLANTMPEWGDHPMVVALNYLKYDAMTPGNHDFDYGVKLIDRMSKAVNFDFIAANAVNKLTGKPFWKPYTVKEVDGVRVGILGLTTLGIMEWLPPSKWEGIVFLDPVKTAEKYVDKLKNEEGCSLVVVAFHGGPKSKNVGDPDDVNLGNLMAETVPGIDLLLLGHTHEIVNAKYIGDTLILQAGSYSHCIGEAKFRLKKGINGWDVLRGSGRILKVSSNIAPDRELLEVLRPYHEKTLNVMNTELVSVSKSVSLKDAAYRDNELMDLISKIQIEYTGAQLSLCSVFDPYASLEDVITIKKLFKLYPYENDLFVLKMTGEQIKLFLENAASAYVIKDNQLGIGSEFPLFNLDVLSGLSYEVDPGRPVGQRILKLSDKGRPVKSGDSYTVAMNSYRAGGSGGYDVVKDAEIVFKSSESVRDIIINYLRRQRFVTMTKDDNWKLVLPSQDVTFEPLAK
jgi:2',3'-cyclic-nucleotide 2'-phosphodiesterase/3'-nucleotidase